MGSMWALYGFVEKNRFWRIFKAFDTLGSWVVGMEDFLEKCVVTLGRRG